MSADTRPITPTRFAVALQDLTPSTLHLKLLEVRNSIAHLEYSNFQLKPYAEGTETALSLPGAPGTVAGGAGPDQDCIDAIRENEGVIARMQERVELIRAEIEGRGMSWAEFDAPLRKNEEEEKREEGGINGVDVEELEVTPSTTATTTNGRNEAAANGNGTQHAAWGDGTFQTGVIRNGEVHMDVPSQSTATTTPGQPRGGTLGDEALRLAMEERMRELEDDGGMHL